MGLFYSDGVRPVVYILAVPVAPRTSMLSLEINYGLPSLSVSQH